MSFPALLPRATLRDLAVTAFTERGAVDPRIVALMAESLLDTLDEDLTDEDGDSCDDAMDLPACAKALKKERDDALKEESDTIRKLKKDVERLEEEAQKLGERIVELESTDAERQIQALTRELAALRETHARELDAAREETRGLRKKILAVAAEDGGVLCRLPGCYNEMHSSDGRCTFHRGDEPLADDHTPAVAVKRPRKRKASP